MSSFKAGSDHRGRPAQRERARVRGPNGVPGAPRRVGARLAETPQTGIPSSSAPRQFPDPEEDYFRQLALDLTSPSSSDSDRIAEQRQKEEKARYQAYFAELHAEFKAILDEPPRAPAQEDKIKCTEAGKMARKIVGRE